MLPRIRQRWRRLVSSRPLQWYAEQKAAQGAFATLLGVRIGGRSWPTWHAVAIGDSCLAVVRGDRLLTLFPIQRSESFSTRPELMGTLDQSGVTPGLRTLRGSCRAGDRLFLMTDALAAWFVCQLEAGGRPWAVLDAFDQGGTEMFAEWASRLRIEREMRNDDVTLLTVALLDRKL